MKSCLNKLKVRDIICFSYNRQYRITEILRGGLYYRVILLVDGYPCGAPTDLTHGNMLAGGLVKIIKAK